MKRPVKRPVKKRRVTKKKFTAGYDTWDSNVKEQYNDIRSLTIYIKKKLRTKILKYRSDIFNVMNAILHTSNFSTASKLVNKIKNMHNDLSDTQQKVNMDLGHLQSMSSDLKQNKHLLNAVKQDEMKKDKVKNNIDKFVKNLKNKVGGFTIQELKNTKNQLDQFTKKTSIIYHKYQSYYNTFRLIESKSRQIINKLSLLTESEFQQRKEEYLDELNVLICKQVHFHEQYVDMNLKWIL